MTTRRNVILITVDSLRADHLGCYGHPINSSPNIDDLARRGTLFRNAISNGGGTPEAFSSILTSVYPPVLPNLYRETMKSNMTIAEVLKLSGYRTAVFLDNPYLSKYFFCNKGFDHFFDGSGDIPGPNVEGALSGRQGSLRNFLSRAKVAVRSILDSIEDKSPTVRAEELTGKAISWLHEYSPQSFFLWIHYMDVHSIPMPPRAYLNQIGYGPIPFYKKLLFTWKTRQNICRLSEPELAEYCRLYDASIRYVDDQIDKLIHELKNEKFADTILVFAADHGEALGEHGLFGHHVALYDEVLHIPLIISGEGIRHGVVTEQVSHMDIIPTLLDILGLEKGREFYGISSLPLMVGSEYQSRENGVISVTYNQFRRLCSCRTPKWKYIRVENLQTTGISHKFYDLENDPGETQNLYDEHESEEAAPLKQQVLRYISTAERHCLEKEGIIRKIERLKAARII